MRMRRWLSFFVALSLLSLSANGYLTWRLYRWRIREWAARWREVPPVRADDQVRGSRDLAVTIIVYSDFECPYCRQLHLRLKGLSSSSRFRWVYRHAPRSGHPGAERAAEAAECAARQGRFWELADSLCQTPLHDGSLQELVQRAEAIGLEGAALRRCLENDETAPRVRAQESEARELWISGTPLLYINGRRVAGLIDVEEIRRLLGEGLPRAPR
jgi:protein-disulfide isomerase